MVLNVLVLQGLLVGFNTDSGIIIEEMQHAASWNMHQCSQQRLRIAAVRIYLLLSNVV
jgi:hypothetical protein